jgi:hypothetical protein
MELLLHQDIHLKTSLLLQILLFLSNRILLPPIWNTELIQSNKKYQKGGKQQTWKRFKATRLKGR